MPLQERECKHRSGRLPCKRALFECARRNRDNWKQGLRV